LVTGSALPEVLLALLLLGLTMGTGLALALDGLRGLAEARQRDQAAALASDLAGTIRAVPGVAWESVEPGVPCPGPCAPEALAAAEFAAWLARVADSLPGGQGAIRPVADGAVSVVVDWTAPDGRAARAELGVLP
jgi:Tfp pilus assembly protein PilV